jgi:acetamidase/formamidase/AraC-like DNA-binding protein
MLNNPQRFSTNTFSEELRQDAWNQALAKVLVANAPASGSCPPLDGHVSSCTSSLKSVFVKLSSTSQVLVPSCGAGGQAGNSLLIFTLLAGSGQIVLDDQRTVISPGDIVVLEPNRRWRVELNTEFRAMLIKLESASFLRRLLRTSELDLNRIITHSGVGAVCLNLLETIAEELEHFDAHELPPIEAALTDLLVACFTLLNEHHGGGSTAVQLGHLRRVCRLLEARLGDPDMTIKNIAKTEGLSSRYIQKLFHIGSTTFGEYVKDRRLERCRIDFANPALAHLTIADLCFRWGFKDAANFSRAFTHRFGLSAKAFRASTPKNINMQVLHRGRPANGSVAPEGVRDHAGLAANARDLQRDEVYASDSKQFAYLLDDQNRLALAAQLSRGSAKPVTPADGATSVEPDSAKIKHHFVPASNLSVHWGYFSRTLQPVITVNSGDMLTIETLTQHATDDCERMVQGDPGAESVFKWTATEKGVDRRGAGPMDASIFGRGAGEGFGVHICTGPVYVNGAEPGDLLEVRILDILPRASCHPKHRGKLFGSNAATWWGFQYKDLLTEPKEREVVTVYEVHTEAEKSNAKALYNYRWTPQTDPFGVTHPTIDYPGVPVDEASVRKNFGILSNAVIPIRPHFGVLAVAPKEVGFVDSIPPSYFGGNLDNWRAGKGSTLFLPVSVEGALFSVGDPHASQGDSELCGTAIECSLTGVFQLVLHKKNQLTGSFLADMNYPFLETPHEWVIQGLSFPNHLAELGVKAQTLVYKNSSLEAAMRDAFRKTRHYLMKAHQLSEDEAISLISVAVDFGITQVVDGNLGIHAVIRKLIFPNYKGRPQDDHRTP